MKKIYLILFSFLAIGCNVEELPEVENELNSQANPHPKFDVPSLTAGVSTENTLEIIITAGETGATGGLSIRWMTAEEYDADGDGEGTWNNDLAGHVLLNAKANEEFRLEPGESLAFSLENHISGEGSSWNRALECGQTYFFIVQAHQDGNLQKSDYSEPSAFSTAPCEIVDDPCDSLAQDIFTTVCSSSINNPTVLGFRNFYKTQIYLKSELEKDGVFDGTFSPTMAELVEEYNASGGLGTFTTNYTVETAECGLVTIEVAVLVKECE